MNMELLNKLSYEELKELKQLFFESATDQWTPYQIGKNYFVRTVTMIQIGKLVGVTQQELVLEQAVWCADTGRFTTALLKGELNEVELFPNDEPVIVGRGAVVDACVWKHNLPKEQK